MREHHYLHRTASLGRYVALAGAVLALVMVSFLNSHYDAAQVQVPTLEVAQLDDGTDLGISLSGMRTGGHCQSGSACVATNPRNFTLPEQFKISGQPRVYVLGWIAFLQSDGLFRPPRFWS